MSLSNDIRDVLRSAPAPLTASEVREELGVEKYTAAQVGSHLSQLTASGEFIRDGELGKFTYLIDPKFKPKRARAADGSVPPPAKKPTVSKAISHTVKRTPAPQRATLKAAVQTIATELQALATMPRASLRTLALAFTAIHPEPMTAELRDAVVNAFQASL